jgi:amino acid transporter
MQLYYIVGILLLAVFWLISWGIIGNSNPFAMAKGGGKNGENENLNASLVQMIVFTMLTVFAYTTVFAAPALSEGGSLIPAANEYVSGKINGTRFESFRLAT